MSTQFLVDSYRNKPNGCVVAECTEQKDEKTFTVKDRLFQNFLSMNDKDVEGFLKEIDLRGSRQYYLVTKEDYEHPERIAQNLVEKILKS